MRWQKLISLRFYTTYAIVSTIILSSLLCMIKKKRGTRKEIIPGYPVGNSGVFEEIATLDMA